MPSGAPIKNRSHNPTDLSFRIGKKMKVNRIPMVVEMTKDNRIKNIMA
jgi:hypothetical protein